MPIKQEVIRNNKGQFVKGVSGNPGGRNKGIAHYIKERTHNLEDLINELLEIYKDKKTNKKDRIKIIEVLLDRSVGRPSQHQSIEVDLPTPIEFTTNTNNEEEEDNAKD